MFVPAVAKVAAVLSLPVSMTLTIALVVLVVPARSSTPSFGISTARRWRTYPEAQAALNS